MTAHYANENAVYEALIREGLSLDLARMNRYQRAVPVQAAQLRALGFEVSDEDLPAIESMSMFERTGEP